MRNVKGLFLLNQYAYDEIYGPDERKDISRLVDIYAPPMTQEDVLADMGVLEPVEVVFTGWGAPRMDETFLANAPNLKAVFHGAGSIRRFVTDAVWRRDIRVTSAAAANAVPVAEYVLSQILFCLKLGWQFALGVRNTKSWPEVHDDGHYRNVFGAYQSTVGLVSMGVISLKLIELLKPFDLNILVCSDYLTPEKAAELGVERCELDELFQRSDVISLHSPATEKNRGLIAGRHIEMMKPYASLINSARGAVIRQREMVDVLQKRPDLVAVLDVTDPEPPTPDSELFTVPNVVITPHIAGSLGKECRRMGRSVVKELERYLADQPLQDEVTPSVAAYRA